jgi:hypothetical protein
MLLVFYALFLLLGIELAVWGSFSISMTTGRAALVPYGVSIAVMAGLSLIGCCLTRHPSIECVSTLLLFALLVVYIESTIGPWSSGDGGRGAIGIVVTIASLVPLFRWTILANRIILDWAAKRAKRAKR